jgi:hypothetical protein
MSASETANETQEMNADTTPSEAPIESSEPMEPATNDNNDMELDVNGMLSEIAQLRKINRDRENQEAERTREVEANQKKIAEFTSKQQEVKNLINTVFEQMGQPIKDDVNRGWEECTSGPEGLDYLKGALAGIVRANTDNESAVKKMQEDYVKLQRELEKKNVELKKREHIAQYSGSDITPEGRFGQTNNRYKESPKLNVPKSIDSSMFYTQKKHAPIDERPVQSHTVSASRSHSNVPKYEDIRNEYRKVPTPNDHRQPQAREKENNIPVTYDFSDRNDPRACRDDRPRYMVKASESNGADMYVREAYSWEFHEAFRPSEKIHMGASDPQAYLMDMLNVYNPNYARDHHMQPVKKTRA